MPSLAHDSTAQIGVAESREPHPFYVFTTVGLALFLLGVAVWPAGAPRFESHATITLHATQGPNADRPLLTDRLAQVGRDLELSEAEARRFSDSGLSWRVTEEPRVGRGMWHLSVSGTSPASTRQRLAAMTDRAVVALETPDSPWAVWVSEPAHVRVMPGRSVTPSQVILLGTLSCLAAGGFTLWSMSRSHPPQLLAPAALAQELDLPVLAMLGVDTARSDHDPTPGFFPWRWAMLRLGEICVLLAMVLTLVQTMRSHEMRELFLLDPLTMFRSVVRPVITAERQSPSALAELGQGPLCDWLARTVIPTETAREYPAEISTAILHRSSVIHPLGIDLNHV